ncbi:MAG: hypothetical protein RMH97_03245, partial [Verrucomicrobiales bacterium]|nr:hypothetical protein [Verrucomicrobiales bacterium]
NSFPKEEGAADSSRHPFVFCPSTVKAGFVPRRVGPRAAPVQTTDFRLVLSQRNVLDALKGAL